MLKISYRAAYTLLDIHYKRTSLNKLLMSDEIPENAVQASLILALRFEDYEYMAVMTSNKDSLDSEYVLFLDGLSDITLTLPREKALTILEFAALSLKCPKIPEQAFIDVIEAQGDGKGLDAIDIASSVESFKFIRQSIQAINLPDNNKGA